MLATQEKVVGMDGQPINYQLINGKEVKLRADGMPKETKNNAKVGRSTWVDPIRSKEDIKKVLDYLQEKIDNEERVDYRKAWARNKLYFCIGVFSGFRVSDLIQLNWQDVYCKDGISFRKSIGIKEKKTGKIKVLYLTEISKRYIMQYVSQYQPDTTSTDFIFLNRQKKQINAQSIDNFIKEATAARGLKGSFSTHSVRKTFVYQMYMALHDSGDPLALEKTMRFTGHRNMSDLLRYLGLKNQQEEADMKVMEDYLDMF